MGNRFDMGGALAGSLTSFMPIANRLCNETCFRTVICQQFWLGLSGLWELGFQDLGNPLMVLLSRVFQQGLRGCVLNECVLEHIGRLRWHTSLIDDLRLH